GHVAAAHRVHGHRDAVPSAARDPRVLVHGVPLWIAHVPRAPDGVRRARLDGILRRRPGATVKTQPERTVPTWVLAAAPLALLIVVLGAFFVLNPLSGLKRQIPPVEELTFDRVVLHSSPREIVAHVTNGGRDPVTVAQVQMDDAYWT